MLGKPGFVSSKWQKNEIVSSAEFQQEKNAKIAKKILFHAHFC